MSTTQLDRIVKGAPPPNVSPDQIAAAVLRGTSSTELQTNSISAPRAPPLDPVSHLPSSPAQIYLNVLILETSLCAQYLSLRARLRLHSLLFGALLLWTLTFTYLLFLRPREDGKGQGGSVYWVVDVGEKLGFVGGIVTWGLVWATGMWERGFAWPRRWVSATNRGLRGFNMKVVVLRGPWWKEMLGYVTLLGPCGYWVHTNSMRYEYLPRDIEQTPGGEKEKLSRLEDGRRETWTEEDVSHGGDTIKVMLLPKPFSTDFREEWESYRSSYWEKENERRAMLRSLLKARERQLAKREGGWLWWTGWRGWRRFLLLGPSKTWQQTTSKGNREKSSHNTVKSQRRKDRSSYDGSTRQGSRSSTPILDIDEKGRLLKPANKKHSHKTSLSGGDDQEKRVVRGTSSSTRRSSNHLEISK